MDPVVIPLSQARRIWLHAQRLDTPAPFGGGPLATPAAIRHLGYVQIDTIHVIERCHHHILFSRIPGYRREHLSRAQSVDKSVFEYWTHAQSYLPVEDMRYFLRTMRGYSKRAVPWFNSVKDIDVRKVLSRIRRHGALSIRDIEDDELIEKDHAWASRKPSRRALHLAFFRGQLAISQRTGMLKTYDLIKRHFGWERMPAMASVRQVNNYLLERSLRSQGIVSLESICHLNAPAKPAVRRLIETRVRRGHLVPVQLPGANKWSHWVRPEDLEQAWHPDMQWVHILSPFDPLIIQRRRLQLFFGYEHRFEAYVPQSKRVFGYFACPVLIGDEVVAAIDMKTNRNRPALLIQKWTWVGHGSARTHKRLIEKALQAFEAFQLTR